MTAGRDDRRAARDGSARQPSAPRESPSPRLEAIIDRVGSVSGRLARVWRRLPSERRLAAGAASGLFLTLFLPWYQETVIARGVTNLRTLSDSMTGWGAFSFAEAAILLVAAGVLVLLFVRADGDAFHVPGGDGGVITAAGAWTCFLIIWRMFDQEGASGHRLYSTTSGIEWGIFVALAAAGVLTYAGTRIRLANETEPPLLGEARPPLPLPDEPRPPLPDDAGRPLPGEPDGDRPPSTGAGGAGGAPRFFEETDMEETRIQVEPPAPGRPSRPSPRSR